MVADLRAPLTVELVDIRGEGGAEVQRITLRELQTQGGLEVTQGSLVGNEVIAHGQAELVDQTDFLEARGVLIRLDLHLDIVRQVEVDTS